MQGLKMTRPEMFGIFHCSAALLCLLIGYFGGKYLAKKDERLQTEVIFRCGLFLLSLELFKQFLLYRDGQPHPEAFPLQLCSTPLYLCLVYPFLKKKDSVKTYFATFILIATLAALIYPEDMLKEEVFLTLQSFLWHGILVFLAVWGFFTMGRDSFPGAAKIFLGFALLAFLLNILFHQLWPERVIDLFYISPYAVTLQPVFHWIAERYGELPETVIYLLSILLGAYGIFCIKKRSA